MNTDHWKCSKQPGGVLLRQDEIDKVWAHICANRTASYREIARATGVKYYRVVCIADFLKASGYVKLNGQRAWSVVVGFQAGTL